MSKFDNTVMPGSSSKNGGEMGFRGGGKGWNGKNNFISSEGEQKVIEKKLKIIQEKKAALERLEKE
jgi:hypothetical protein